MSIKQKTVSFLKRVWLPVLVLALGVVASVGLVKAKPEPEKKEHVVEARKVRVVTAHADATRLSVETQGTVQPKQMIDLTPRVSGNIVYVSDKFVAGGTFKKGETILRIDARDYEAAVTSAEARVAEARQRLAQEQQEAALAKEEWELLGQGEASDLVLRKPQLADAEAKLKAAEAALYTARLDLERTDITAPFNGILTEKFVDLGQYMSPGSKMGMYYSTDVLEVRLPLTNRDLGKFDLVKLQNNKADLKVTLTGTFANKNYTWKGRIARSEGVIDTKSRILYVVAELKGDELYSVENGLRMTIGQFVSAEIEGRAYANVYQLPRQALRQGDSVLVVDADNKLRTRKVEVLESTREHIVVANGIKEGDKVCISQLGIAVDGTLVEAVPADAGSLLSAVDSAGGKS
ncbi:efflux RND transporter periplasmic adaptor subunit [Emcibacter nanhaiensis]|uniref:Efflux RND transporter periplasmic adaptor subunit n=1 Tax=Emcibacter nanhaiensis TaxID=1505037 RepID=A0A501PNN2_9PROT|nr:efflux RND transporter periplasmic adaptor subunit [Emcibacter nanhaiensis]TPD61702.1 efflux RND transporter periplasmic adaptor subunit [Emcibacter nanhaiensis]